MEDSPPQTYYWRHRAEVLAKAKIRYALQTEEQREARRIKNAATKRRSRAAAKKASGPAKKASGPVVFWAETKTAPINIGCQPFPLLDC